MTIVDEIILLLEGHVKNYRNAAANNNNSAAANSSYRYAARKIEISVELVKKNFKARGDQECADENQKVTAVEREKDMAIQDKEKAEQDRDDAKKEKEEAIKAKQKAEKDKENADKEKEKAIKDKQNAEKEKEEALKEKQDAIDELTKLKEKITQDKERKEKPEQNPEFKKSVLLQAGFKGFISAVTNADYEQAVTFVIKKNNPEKTKLSRETHEGQGKGIQMQRVGGANNRNYKPFGPLNEDAIVEITLHHGADSTSSKMVTPLSVHKNPDNNYPIEVDISTVICADGVDTSYGDCMIHVIQFK